MTVKEFIKNMDGHENCCNLTMVQGLDTTVLARDEGLYPVRLSRWFTGSPERLCNLEITFFNPRDGSLKFRDKKELRKFAKWLLRFTE